jgi:pimeloyl-ACP methyl ester carboxylesterase
LSTEPLLKKALVLTNPPREDYIRVPIYELTSKTVIRLIIKLIFGTMIEREIYFTSETVKISGTILLPNSTDSFSIVLLVPGSGQVDRNENHKKIHINVFRDIAEFLAKHNIATLRYDKRGIGISGGNYWETGFHDNASDALAAIDFLKTQDNIQPDRIILLGHSEGAFIATKLAGEGANVAGVILIAGTTKSGEETLKWQALQIAKGMKGINRWLIKLLRINVAKSQQKQLDKIKKSTRDYYRVQLIAKLNAKWMREFLAFDPTEYLPNIKVPVLAITGAKDIQVDPDDLKTMAEIMKAPFEFHIVSDMNHILRYEEDDASISNYKKLAKQPMDSRILQLILTWLQCEILCIDSN